MKRIFTVLVVIVLGSIAIPNIQAIAAITPGVKCTKAGVKQIYKGKTFTCVKSGKKLVWNKGVLVKPTPTPTPTPNVEYSVTGEITDVGRLRIHFYQSDGGVNLAANNFLNCSSLNYKWGEAILYETSVYSLQGSSYFDLDINPIDENEIPIGLTFGGCKNSQDIYFIPRVNYKIDWNRGDPKFTRLAIPFDIGKVLNYVPEFKNISDVNIQLVTEPETTYARFGVEDSEPPKFIDEAITRFTYRASYPHDICFVELRNEKGVLLESSSLFEKTRAFKFFDRIRGFGQSYYVGDQKNTISASIKCNKSGQLEFQFTHPGVR